MDVGCNGFFLQILLASFMMLDQQNTEFGDTTLKIPIRVTVICSSTTIFEIDFGNHDTTRFIVIVSNCIVFIIL